MIDFDVDYSDVTEPCHEVLGLVFDLGSQMDRELLEAVLLDCLDELSEAA